MRKKVFSSVRKHRLGVFAGILVCASLATIFVPALSLSVGNTFFGGNAPLYNVRLAQFLFEQAAHPLLPVSTPRYAHYQLSRTEFIRGDLVNALDEIRAELSLYPGDTGAYYILGLTLGYMGRTYEAIDAFSTYIDTHPGTWAGRNDKAWLQFRLGDIDGALATIEPIANNFKFTPWVQNTYCVLLINKQRYEEAQQVCERAKEEIDAMSTSDWGRSYPGNDPRIYGQGLSAMKATVQANLELLQRETNG